MTESGGQMRMEPVEQIEIPPRGRVALEPGGLHLMLFGARPLRAGETVHLTLRFAVAGAIEIAVPVRAAAGRGHASS